MKKFILFFLILTSHFLSAQNVGINNSNPRAALDLSGDLILRSALLKKPSSNLVVNVSDVVSSVYRFDDNYPDMKIGGFDGSIIGGPKGGVDGRIFTIFNNTSDTIEIYNEYSSVDKVIRIITGTSSTALIYQNGSVTFRYDGELARWTIVSSNNTDGLNSPWITSGGDIINKNGGNVGIGTSIPQEKLHVGGNIRAEGLAGNGFRTLQVDDNGTMSAIAANMGFKNMIVFNVTSNWLVPSDVAKIYVEAWGGGGGAGIYKKVNGELFGGGAGAGAYSYNYANVVPNSSLTITVGSGGQGSNTEFGNAGSKSEILGIVYAGGGLSTVGGGYFYQNLCTTISGENGNDLELSYGNSSASNFNMIIKLGDGGSAHKGGRGGKGEWLVTESTGAVSLSIPYTIGRNIGGFPGGGGGCGYPRDGLYTGGRGGDGLVIIYY
jgi:hypothetical protein